MAYARPARRAWRAMAGAAACVLPLAACQAPVPRMAPPVPPVESPPASAPAAQPALAPAPSPAAPAPAQAPAAAVAEPPQQSVRFLAEHENPLPQVDDGDWLAAWPAWLASCSQLAGAHNPHREAWIGVCAAALVLEPRDGAAVREFFLHTMDRYRVLGVDAPPAPGAGDAGAEPPLPHERDTGLVTGYYEIRIEGSRVPSVTAGGPAGDPSLHPFVAPIYGRIDPVPTAPRAELLASGVLRGHELLWLRDPVEAFFLEVQGSGRVHLPDGSWVRVAYAGSNGQPYRSIGRWLLEQGELEPGHLSMQAIIEWAQQHPERVPEMLAQNPRMVFFREVAPGDKNDSNAGPSGSLGVALTAGESVAVDPRFVPLGAPLLVSTVAPGSQAALVRMVFAQDTGGAIRGPLRVDWFWGSGEPAGTLAGRQRAPGTVRLFVPRGVDPAKLL